MIKVNNLSRIFKTGSKEIRAIDDISFEIPDKSFITITGKSGSGKSTLLYQLGLLDHPTSGSIMMQDADVTKLDPKIRNKYRLENIGYIFQDYALIPTLNAVENVVIPLLMQGNGYKTAYEIAQNALENVGLGDRYDNLPSQLSGGEQQRVSIARAIAHNPKIIYADEPTANLDSETADKVLDLIIKLNKNGQTIVMVTHEPDYAALGQKQLILSDGKIVSFK